LVRVVFLRAAATRRNAMSTIRRWRETILIALVVAVPSWGAEPAKVRVDLYGDPLPKGAVARLGSVRFRHPGAVHEVAFSPDGKLLAASSDGLNMVIVWERATGRKLREIPVGTRPGYPPTHLRFSSDGKRLYGSSSYGRDMRLYAWEVGSGKEAADVPALPTDARTLGYSPDGREILLLHRDAEVVRWDIAKGK
jgi:WD40 repeat protein